LAAKITFGSTKTSFKISIQIPDKTKDMLKTLFDKFKDKITFGAIPDKRRFLLMQTDRIKDKFAFGTS
jgi:hypothetical protein